MGVVQAVVAGAAAANQCHCIRHQRLQRTTGVDEQRRIGQVEQGAGIARIVQRQDVMVVVGVQPGECTDDGGIALRIIGQQGAGNLFLVQLPLQLAVGGVEDRFGRAEAAQQQLAGHGAHTGGEHQFQPGAKGFIVQRGAGFFFGNVRSLHDGRMQAAGHPCTGCAGCAADAASCRGRNLLAW